MLGRIDRLSAIFSGYDPGASSAGGSRATWERPACLAELFERSPGIRRLEGADRRGLRSPGRNPVAALGGLRPPGPIARRGRDRASPGHDGPARLAARSGDGHRRAALGLPAQPQRDRQGLHRRAGLRRGDGRGPGRPGRDAQRRRRPARPRRISRRRSASPRPGPIPSRPTRSPSSRSGTGRSPPAAARSAGSRIGGRWYSHVFDPRTGRAGRARRRRDRDRPERRSTPTRSPRRAMSSSPRNACVCRESSAALSS